MNNRKNIIIAVGIVAVIALVFFFWLNPNSKTKYVWHENYKPQSKQPYGTKIIHKILETHFEDYDLKIVKNNLEVALPATTDQPANYIYIGDGYYPNDEDMERLLEFAASGNHVFIASNNIPRDFMQEYLPQYFEACQATWRGYESFADTSTYINLTHIQLNIEKGYPFKYQYRNKTRKYYWQYIADDYFCEDIPNMLSIGTIGENWTNFARIVYGDGIIFLHTTPLVFTNYHMVTENGRNYAEKVLAHLQEGDIYWDQYSQEPYRNENQFFEPVSLSDRNPLEYILSERSLAWAWYLLLGMAVLFLLFRTKRRQKVIPVAAPNTNTSLEFVETIGRLYFQQNNHKKLSEQKMKLFLGFLRERYHFSTQDIDEKAIQKLSNISEIDFIKVQVIFKRFHSMKKLETVTEHQLIQFHLAIEYFYKNCK